MKKFFAAMLPALMLIAPQLISGAPEKPVIVASVVPVYNIVKEIAGDRFDLRLMVPPGASPHTFSPKPSAVISLAKAKAFFMAGAGLEFWADKMAGSSGNKDLRIARMTDGIKLLQENSKGEAHPGSGNPHVWLDPVYAKAYAKKTAGMLSEIMPEDKKYFSGNYLKFASEIDALDRRVREEAKNFHVKDFIAFHPSWVYFAERYGLKEIGEIEKTPGKSPTPREIEEIISEIKSYRIKAVFAEPQLPRKAADVIAQQAGIQVLILDPLGSTDEKYTDFIKRNFEIMKEAMK